MKTEGEIRTKLSELHLNLVKSKSARERASIATVIWNLEWVLGDKREVIR